MVDTEPTHRFDTDTAVTSLGENRWSADVRPGWAAIGGNPNGGYVLAVALAAAAEAVPGADPLSVNVHYVRPTMVGPAEVDVDIAKLGRLKSTVSAKLSQGGAEKLRLLATFGNRDALGWPDSFAVEPPSIPGPDECAAPPVTDVGAGADILERFDYRVTPTARWITGERTGTARLDGWIRFSDGREPDLASLPLIVDAFPPAVYEVVDAAMVPTLELSIHLRQRPAAGWLQARFQTRALVGGVIEEDAELWDSKGQLVAMSRQLALVQPFG